MCHSLVFVHGYLCVLLHVCCYIGDNWELENGASLGISFFGSLVISAHTHTYFFHCTTVVIKHWLCSNTTCMCMYVYVFAEIVP